MSIKVRCPSCKSTIRAAADQVIHCPRCGMSLHIPQVKVPPFVQIPRHAPGPVPAAARRPTYDEPVEVAGVVAAPSHSSLGIGSFVVAVLVAGMVGLMSLLVLAERARDSRFIWQPSMFCVWYGSVPFCLIGCGMGFAAIVAQRDKKHGFSWIGLVVNATVLLTLLGYYLGQTFGIPMGPPL